MCKNLPNNEILGSAVEHLTPSARYLLILLITANGSLPYYDLRQKFAEKYRASSTYYDAYGSVLDSGLAGEFETGDEGSTSIIPDELQIQLTEIIRTKYPDDATLLPTEKIEEVEEEPQKIQSINDILVLYSQKVELQTLLEEAGVAKTGTKNELVERILNKTTYKAWILLDILFSKAILQDICKTLGIPSSGIKPKLIERITTKVGFTNIDPAYFASSSRRPKDEVIERPKIVLGKYGVEPQIGQEEDKDSFITEEKQSKVIIQQKLTKEVFDFLSNKLKLHHSIINDDSDLEASVYSALMSDYLKEKGIETRPYKNKDSGTDRPDYVITNGSEEIYLEVKYTDQKHPQNTINETHIQYSKFKADHKDSDIIILIYDRDGKISKGYPNDIERFEKLTSGLFKYLTQDDFYE